MIYQDQWKALATQSVALCKQRILMPGISPSEAQIPTEERSISEAMPRGF
jgi:hypothetical protein